MTTTPRKQLQKTRASFARPVESPIKEIRRDVRRRSVYPVTMETTRTTEDDETHWLSSNPTDSTKGREAPWRDEKTLRRLYVEEGLTQQQIADELDSGRRTIGRWIRHYEIPPQDPRGAKDASHLPVTYRSYKKDGGRVYECWTHKSQWVRVHRLLAVAEYGFDAVSGMDVHHKNNIPWDNRPSNIELLTRSEHSRHHAPGKSEDSVGAKLTEAEVREILAKLDEGERTQESIGEEYGVRREAISDIARGATWSSVRREEDE